MKDIDDTKQPLLEHLIELRRRLLWCLATLVVTFFLCFHFATDIFAISSSRCFARARENSSTRISSKPFFVQVKAGLFAALMLSFPVLATQLWRFVAPGLYAKEKKAFPAVPARNSDLLRRRRGLRLFRSHAWRCSSCSATRAMSAASAKGAPRSAITSTSSHASCSASALHSCCRSCS